MKNLNAGSLDERKHRNVDLFESAASVKSTISYSEVVFFSVLKVAVFRNKNNPAYTQQHRPQRKTRFLCEHVITIADQN